MFFACCESERTDNQQLLLQQTIADSVIPKEDLAPSVKAPEVASSSETSSSGSTFVVELVRSASASAESNALGLLLDLADDAVCLVKSVEGGLAGKWNATRPQERTIKMYDRIVAVNNTRGKSKALASLLLQVDDKVPTTITIQRPIERQVVLEKDCELGILVKYKNGSLGFWIDRVDAGLVDTWNKKNPEAEAVRVHDRVIAVNGQMGNAASLLSLMKDLKIIEFTVLHYKVQEADA
eukprot:TRINITY_DN59214_c0_g1_i1.p1 TRINITY_DN59214_c0_g1~~TRINITY_DN59214_c0_g1_i1.p1  ORF type:complete len:277 (+),score=48.33 TRINITY_DN59214_c0_g1_i1:119-832(+)